jgi:hypothetical protein
MTDDPLPPELLTLERELTDRPWSGPPAELRSRVLAAVAAGRPSPRLPPARVGFAGFVAATAAAALLAINLSASVANDSGLSVARYGGGAVVAETADHVRALDPDASDRDALRQAIVLHAVANITPAPVPNERHLRNKDTDRWDMP